MDPQFERATIIIIAISLAVFGTGALLLVLAYRAFGSAKRGDVKHVVLMVSTIIFVFLACLILLVWSALQRG